MVLVYPSYVDVVSYTARGMLHTSHHTSSLHYIKYFKLLDCNLEPLGHIYYHMVDSLSLTHKVII